MRSKLTTNSLQNLGIRTLGGGIALLLANLLAPYAAPILLLGLISHATGMFQKHGLERQEQRVRIWWAEALYWLCWAALAVLLLFIVIGQL